MSLTNINSLNPAVYVPTYSFNIPSNGTPYAYGQNPFQASFYYQSNVYPYNPIYAPVMPNPNYDSLGTVTSPDGEVAHLFRLKNGQRVAVIPRKDEATVIKTFVDAGSMNETDEKRGLMHLIEHGLFKGSKNLKDGEVFKYTSLMGATTNASTDYALVSYYITAPYMKDSDFEKAVEIQGDMISNPLFDKDSMESEKGPVCSEISMINDDPMTVAFDSVIRNLFQIDSKSENMVAGSIDTVKSATKDDMHQYHKNYYNPDNLYTVVVGDVDVYKTMDLIAKNFNTSKEQSNTNVQTITPIESTVRKDIISSKTNSANSLIAFSGPKPNESKDFIILQMLDYYLGHCSTSELKNNLEKINASYSSSAQKVGLKDNDPYALVSLITSNPNDEQKGLDAFYDAIIKLQTTPLTDDEMTTLKNVINKSNVISMCDSQAICDVVGNSMIDNSLELFSNYKNLISSVTKEDIMNFARKYYDLNKASIVVLHPSSVNEDDIKKNYENSKYSLKNSISFCGNSNISTNNVNEQILKNNTHLVVNTTKSDLCVFNWSVNTPPIKPKNPNIPHVLMYIFEKGTDYKSQLELEQYKEKNAIDTNIYVNGKSIEISANCLTDEISKTLDIINELMYNPKFTQKDFDDAKKYVKDMLKSSQKDASSNLLDKLYPGFFPTDSNMLQTIDDLTLDDVKEFYFELLKNASSAFVATVNENNAAQNIELIKNSLDKNDVKFKEFTPKLNKMFEPEKTAKVVYDTDDLNQAQIYKSYKFPISGNIKDEIKFELLNTIVGGSPASRLFSDLRTDKNLAYSVSSTIQSFENTGILTLKIQTTTDNKDADIKSYENVQKSLDGFKQHTDLLMKEYVSDEELEAAKTKLKQTITGQFQNPMSKTELLAMNVLEPYGIKRIDEYYKAIDSITKEDIMQAAKFVFSNKPTISILASEDTINSQMEYLKTQGEVQKAA